MTLSRRDKLRNEFRDTYEKEKEYSIINIYIYIFVLSLYVCVCVCVCVCVEVYVFGPGTANSVVPFLSLFPSCITMQVEDLKTKKE